MKQLQALGGVPDSPTAAAASSSAAAVSSSSPTAAKKEKQKAGVCDCCICEWRNHSVVKGRRGLTVDDARPFRGDGLASALHRAMLACRESEARATTGPDWLTRPFTLQFHYKCIRPMLQMHHPGFACPLCVSPVRLMSHTPC